MKFILSLLSVLFLTSCANFRKLGENLRFMESAYVVSAVLEGADRYPNTYGLVVEWDADSDTVRSADFCQVGEAGLFGFVVLEPRSQYLLAFSDVNENERYDAGEPSWIHTDANGEPAPVEIDFGKRRSRTEGKLSDTQRIPEALIEAAKRFKGARTVREAASGLSIPVALGTVADLDDPRFAAVRGEVGLWEPARFPLELGTGIYFLEPYDPDKIPVLFVYGAAGSPQDWRSFFSGLNRDRYQPWFYFFPSGRELDKLADTLNYGVTVLQHHYDFDRLHLVAHSMGGLIARGFLIRNVLEDGNDYIDTFVSISTPWGGHEAAEMGVKHAPEVVPSWRDMEVGSAYQKAIFARRLRPEIDHLLLYGHHSSRSFILPKENDGTVSVASETAPAAMADAVRVKGYDADHVGILSRPDVIRDVQAFLDGGLR